MKTWKRLAGVLAATVLAAGLAGCSDSGPTVAPSETRISIADDISASRMADGIVLSVAGTLAPIPPEDVASLELVVADIAYLPADGEDDGEGAWVTYTLADTVTIDLMNLPTEQEGSIVIGEGSVPVGSYKMVRLLVGEGEIVFATALSVGASNFDAGTPYPVTIPSGDQTGLKTDVRFEVTEGEGGTGNAAYLVFDPDATFQNITAAGSGRVNLTPVLRSR